MSGFGVHQGAGAPSAAALRLTVEPGRTHPIPYGEKIVVSAQAAKGSIDRSLPSVCRW
jgi:hypothetical protein